MLHYVRTITKLVSSIFSSKTTLKTALKFLKLLAVAKLLIFSGFLAATIFALSNKAETSVGGLPESDHFHSVLSIYNLIKF